MADAECYGAFLVNSRTGIRAHHFTSKVDEREILENHLYISDGLSGRAPRDEDVKQVRSFLNSPPGTQYLDSPWVLAWLDTRNLEVQA